MEIPNIAKGRLYPSTRIARCPRFHRCTISNKCQNFDCHQHECILCEGRTNYHEMIGGYLPEGEYIPDLQDAMGVMAKKLRKPMAHPDNESQKIDGEDISRKYTKEREAADMLAKYMETNKFLFEDKIVGALQDSDENLGRLS